MMSIANVLLSVLVKELLIVKIRLYMNLVT